ncbi:hypothetical protein M422DRAFT_275554 [Sphaerobolus stellatus SS14]|uniref:Unplaced genomic scaffold SPHSTscaffold_510, whole genome shotgun sequence n=1 Tax=Sphaerobolus stellatus (strain SS14) TaxID=990650 RepID=A0A0C9U3U5_SPHS4|nr:hypothetical protein M422DRAFT_275554 [Sphaerobolus stellatus SS14]
MDSPPPSCVDPQQSAKVFAQEHLSDPSVRVHSPSLAWQMLLVLLHPVHVYQEWLKLWAHPLKVEIPLRESFPVQIEGTTSVGSLMNLIMHILRKEVWKMKMVALLLKLENGEIVLVEAMEATEWLNTVFNQIRTSMNRMPPTMKDIFLVPKQKSSGKTIEPGNNRAHDKAAAKAATEQIVTQGATSVPITGRRQEEHERLVQSRREWESDENSLSPRRLNIHSTAISEQSEDSQPHRGCDMHTVYVCSTRDECMNNQSRTHRTHDVCMTEDTCANLQESMQNKARCEVSPINTWQELEH